MSLGGYDSIFNAMLAHKQDGEVQVAALKALFCILHYPEISDLLKESSRLEALLCHVQPLGDRKSVV